MNNSEVTPNIISAIAVLGSAVIAATGAIIVERKKVKSAQNDKYKIINDRITIDGEIHGMLGGLLAITNGDRAYIYQFHPDQHPQYFSCSYEEVRAGISNEVTNRQHLLLSQHPCFLQKLKEDNATCSQISTMCNELFGKLLKSQGVQVVCYRGIKNSAGYLIGFIGIDYTDNLTSLNCDINSILEDFVFSITNKLASYEK